MAARLTVYKARDGRRYGVLSGGETRQDYEISDAKWFESEKQNCGDKRTWLKTQAEACGLAPHEYAWSFEHIRIAADVTNLGPYCFAYFENANFTFENPKSVQHLGKCAFSRTAIRGKVAFPSLQDAVLPDVFSGCTKLTEIDLTGSNVKEIGEYAFSCCHNLEKIMGCRKLHTIGARAFSRCAKLTYIDFSSKELTSVGHAAFHISGVGKRLDNLPHTTFAKTARRKDKFEEHTLTAMQVVQLPNVGGLPKTVCEQSYPDLEYGLLPDGTQDYLVNGCMMFSLYHAYQRMFPDSGFDTFYDWWKHVDDLCVDALGVHIWQTDRYAANDVWKILYVVLVLLGLVPKDFSDYALKYPRVDESCGYSCALMTYDDTAKREIWQALASGCGVLASISTGAPKRTEPDVFFENNHMVAIVGCRNGKLLVVDSASIDGENGGAYEVAYEDLFMGAQYTQNCIVVIMKS